MLRSRRFISLTPAGIGILGACVAADPVDDGPVAEACAESTSASVCVGPDPSPNTDTGMVINGDIEVDGTILEVGAAPAPARCGDTWLQVPGENAPPEDWTSGWWITVLGERGEQFWVGASVGRAPVSVGEAVHVTVDDDEYVSGESDDRAHTLSLAVAGQQRFWMGDGTSNRPAFGLDGVTLTEGEDYCEAELDQGTGVRWLLSASDGVQTVSLRNGESGVIAAGGLTAVQTITWRREDYGGSYHLAWYQRR